MREIKQVIKEKLEESQGITFNYCNHDGVESAKGKKLQSFGLKFFKGIWCYVWGARIRMKMQTRE